MAVSNFTASVTGTGTGVVYHAAFHLTETSGKVGANITSFTFTFSNGGTATVPGNAVHVAAGGSTDTGTINLLDLTESLGGHPNPAIKRHRKTSH